MTYLTLQKFRAELERLVAEARGISLAGKSVNPVGEFTCSFDINDFFLPDHELSLKGMSNRLSGVRHTLLRIQHTMGVILFLPLTQPKFTDEISRSISKMASKRP